MKKNIVLFFAFIFPLFVFNACSSSDDGNNEPVTDQIIATSNFVLDIPYQWSVSKQSETFLVINDKVEMEKYLGPVTYGIIDPVNTPDFDKYSLILATGPSQSGVDKIETKLVKHNATDYTFEINVFTNTTSVAEGYRVAVTVPKFANNVNVVKKPIIK